MVFNVTFNNISFISWRFLDVFIWLFQCSIITLALGNDKTLTLNYLCAQKTDT